MGFDSIFDIVASVTIGIFSIFWLGMAIYIAINLKKIIKFANQEESE